MHTSFPPLSPHPSQDARDAVHSLIQSASHYVDARLRIATLEGREALRAGARMAVLGTLVLLSLGVAYAGAMLALAWWLSERLGSPSAVPGVAVLVAAHLLLAAVCAAWMMRAWRGGRFFYATRKEFKEDKRWLEARHPSRS